MNMYPSKKPNTGWILCPSNSFPGKYYYFNVATGETAWCSNEPERTSKNPLLQRADHCYPEPSSPPAEEAPTEPILQTLKFNSYNERTISNYPQEPQNLPKNLSFAVQPYSNQIVKQLPYQVQLPTIWSNDGNTPQVLMIVMNQAMSQLDIDPTQGFRQPNHAIVLNGGWHQPIRAWKEPNAVLEPKQAWIQPNRGWNEPNRAWKESNRAWKEPSPVLERNQAWTEPYRVWKEPDRELFIHSGKSPLNERFINYKQPCSEMKDGFPKQNQPVRQSLDSSAKNQYEISSNLSHVPVCHPNRSDQTSKPNHDNGNQQKAIFRPPILNWAKEKVQHSMPYDKRNAETNSSVFIQNASPVSSQKIVAKSSQNISKANQGLFRQSQVNKPIFGQRLTDQGNVGQSHTRQPLFGQNQTRQKIFGQNQTRQKIFGESQTKQPLFGQSQTKQPLFLQSPSNKDLPTQATPIAKAFEQTQTNENVFEATDKNKPFGQIPTKRLIEPSQTCSETVQSSNVENPFQKIIAKNLAPSLKQNNIPQSPNLDSDLPTSFEHVNNTNTKEKTTLISENKPENSEKELQLDKNDLRMILLGKKRKHNVMDTSDNVEAKKIKTSMKQYTTAATPKKTVTFNMDHEMFTYENNEDASYTDMEYQDVSLPDSDRWYVVTDARTLLENFNDLDGFVKSDVKCNLMIPSGVMSDIEGVSRGECRERNLVTLARHLLRALATHQPHIVVQPSADISLDISTDDSILNCCLELIDKAYVVLITDDDNLQRTAEYLSINCFTSDQIKNGQVGQPTVHFDITKVEITVPNESDSLEVPTKKFEDLSFGTENWDNEKQASPNWLDVQFNSNGTEASEPELNHNAKFKDSEENSITFEIQKGSNYVTSTLKSQLLIGDENKFSMENNGKQEDMDERNIEMDNQLKNLSYSKVQKKINKEDNFSVFKDIDDRIKIKSPFELDNEIQSKPIEKETRGGQPKPIVRQDCFVEIKNKYLELFLKRFYDKNRMIENMVRDRRDEIDCSLKQIMEECLDNILQTKMQEVHMSQPPWSLTEALQGLRAAYTNHTYICDVVRVFTNALNASGGLPARDVIKTVGCGMALVKYLLFITPTSEVLKDTEAALGAILVNITRVVEAEPAAPACIAPDVGCVEKNNYFVKDPKEVVKYLKKHYPAWADYDETSEEYTSNNTLVKNYKTSVIVRTSGKNLNMLKLNSSKAMTMGSDSTHNIAINATTIRNGQNTQRNVDFDNNNTKTENMDVENDNFDKDRYTNFKLTRIVNNTAEVVVKDNVYDQKLISNEAKERQESQWKQTEPKIIRLFGVDNKDNTTKIAQEKIKLDDFTTHGHTFGTTVQTGPRILRNIKPIQEFEQKYQFERKPLDLDEIDYSVMSKSDENNNIASESTNNNTLAMSIENDKQTPYLDATNDTQNGGKFIKNTYDTIDLDAILSTNYNNKSIIDNIFDSDNIYSRNDNYDVDAMNDAFQRLNYSFDAKDEINDLVQKDDATIDSGYENASLQAYYMMDTFLYELKIAFEAMHKFLWNSVRALRDGPLSMSTRNIHDTAASTRARLGEIMENLKGIIHRESSSGPKLKELLAGAGSLTAADERKDYYGEIVTKCYQHAQLIDNALKAMLTITKNRKQ